MILQIIFIYLKFILGHLVSCSNLTVELKQDTKINVKLEQATKNFKF